MLHISGTHDLSIDQLRDPPECMRVREVKDWYVQYLADELRRDNRDLEDITAKTLHHQEQWEAAP